MSAAGAGASVLLPQALSMNAATKAQKLSLVFIYRYPKNYLRKSLGAELFVLAHHPNTETDFRGFHPIFISLFLDAPRCYV